MHRVCTPAAAQRTRGLKDGHAQDAAGAEARGLVEGAVKPGVVVGVGDDEFVPGQGDVRREAARAAPLVMGEVLCAAAAAAARCRRGGCLIIRGGHRLGHVGDEGRVVRVVRCTGEGA